MILSCKGPALSDHDHLGFAFSSFLLRRNFLPIFEYPPFSCRKSLPAVSWTCLCCVLVSCDVSSMLFVSRLQSNVEWTRFVGSGSFKSITDNSLTLVLRCWTGFCVADDIVFAQWLASIIAFFTFSVEGWVPTGISLSLCLSNPHKPLFELELLFVKDLSFNCAFMLSLDETA